MASIRDVEIARREREQKFEPNHNPTWGVIAEVDGSTSPPNEPNLTWVDEFNRSANRKKYLNPTALNTAGAVVELAPDLQPPYRKIAGAWTKGLPPGSTVPLSQFNTPNHGPNHQYPSEASPGEDAVKIYQPAWQPLKTTGNGQNLSVETQPLNYTVEGTRKVFPGASTNLTSYVPSAGLVRRVLLYLDTNTNAIQIAQGTAVTNNGAIPIPYPVVPSGMRGSAWIKLANGQTAVTTATHIDDARDTADSANSGRFVRKTGDTMTGPLVIDGSEDAVQLTIQGNTAQTANILLIEQSSGTDLLTLSNAGQMALPIQGANGGLVLGGDIQLYRSAANQGTIPDLLILDSTPGDAKLRIKTNNSAGSGTANSILEFYDGSALGFEFLAGFGQALAANRYGGFIARSDRDGNELPLRFFTARTDGNLGSSLYIEAGIAAGKAGKVGIGPLDANSLPQAMLHVKPDTFASGLNVSPIAIFEVPLADGTAGSGGYIGWRQVDVGNAVTTADAARIAAIHEVADLNQGNTGMYLYTSPSGGSATLRTIIDRNGNLVHSTAALATNATDGFLYIPTCAGAPTGTPTAYTGRVPIVFNTTDNKIHVFDGSWLATAALT